MRILFVSILCCIFFVSCQKLDIKRNNRLTSENVTVNNSLVTATSVILDISAEGITEYGHCWALTQEPALNNFSKKNTANVQTGYFTDTLKGLEANKTYYLRSFIRDGTNIKYGEQKTFTTTGNGILSIALNPLAVSNTTATVQGKISNIHSLKIIDYGHCWNKTGNPTITDSKTSFGELSQDINFTSSLSDLMLETPFYVRAYAKADNSTVIYSDTVIVIIPQLTVQTLSNQITSSTTSLLTGSITKLGINTVTDHGFCWSVSTSSPTLNDNKISMGTVLATGQFSTTLSGLSQGVRYYFRAYAIDNATVRYGQTLNFMIQ